MSRISECLETLDQLCPEAQKTAIIAEIKRWTDQNTQAAEKFLSLGNTGPTGEIIRKYFRACVLAAVALKNADPDLTKSGLMREEAQFSEEFFARRILSYWNTDPHTPGVRFATSFAYGDRQKMQSCRQAHSIAKQAIEHACKDLGDVRHILAAQSRYEYWFGKIDAYCPKAGCPCYELVRRNITKLRDEISRVPIYLYNRTKSTRGVCDWPFLQPMDLGVEMSELGATAVPSQRAKLAKGSERTDVHAVHIMLGAGVEAAKNPTEAIAETIVHEMSHYVCNTKDVKLKTKDDSGASFGFYHAGRQTSKRGRLEEPQPGICEGLRGFCVPVVSCEISR